MEDEEEHKEVGVYPRMLNDDEEKVGGTNNIPGTEDKNAMLREYFRTEDERTRWVGYVWVGEALL